VADYMLYQKHNYFLNMGNDSFKNTIYLKWSGANFRATGFIKQHALSCALQHQSMVCEGLCM